MPLRPPIVEQEGHHILPFADSARSHSLPPWQSDLLAKVRENIVGGLVTCLHRAVILDGSDGPEAAKIAPNGKPYKTIIPYDFNR